jgi:AcrR family transcriptional regulator
MVTHRPARPARATPEPRNRDATRERILAAVGTLLAREGFSSLGVNAVAREAGVDKVLIYRYFGGIEALLDAWGREALAGPSPAAAPERAPGDAAGRAAAALLGFARAAREHPQALEVMRWELVEDNALTRRLAELREAAGFADLDRLGVDDARAREVDLPAVAAILSAGLLHLALRARTAPRWLGIPLRTRQGWARLERAAALLVHRALAAPAAAVPATGKEAP